MNFFNWKLSIFLYIDLSTCNLYSVFFNSFLYFFYLFLNLYNVYRYRRKQACIMSS